MSFLFERTITIKRARHQDTETEGLSETYGGIDETNMETLFEGVACSIQSRSSGRANPTGLPADTRPASWFILIPAEEAPQAGDIMDDDFVYDDLGRRFQVQADYSHSMGWRLSTDRLRA